MYKLDPQAEQLRQVQVYIGGTPFTPPPPRLVPWLLAAWLEWTAGAGMDYPTTLRSGLPGSMSRLCAWPKTLSIPSSR
jgi:hypothetical protein